MSLSTNILTTREFVGEIAAVIMLVTDKYLGNALVVVTMEEAVRTGFLLTVGGKFVGVVGTVKEPIAHVRPWDTAVAMCTFEL